MGPILAPKELLKQAGMRATPGRIALISLLLRESKPLSVSQIATRMERSLNDTTLYRALQELYKAKLVRRVNLEHEHAHYEMAVGRPHHHHAVCRNCGRVEDIQVPHHPHPEREALKKAQGFSLLDSYALDFFGVCKKCA